MSKDELGTHLGEEGLAARSNSIIGLLAGLAVKYGLPSVVCIYLFYVIDQKDRQIFSMSKEVTSALVDSTSSKREIANALKELADAINRPR